MIYYNFLLYKLENNTIALRRYKYDVCSDYIIII